MGTSTERQLAAAARKSALERIIEKTGKEPLKVGSVLAANPDLLSGVEHETVAQILTLIGNARDGKTVLEAVAASRRCPKGVKLMILDFLIVGRIG